MLTAARAAPAEIAVHLLRSPPGHEAAVSLLTAAAVVRVRSGRTPGRRDVPPARARRASSMSRRARDCSWTSVRPRRWRRAATRRNISPRGCVSLQTMSVGSPRRSRWPTSWLRRDAPPRARPYSASSATISPTSIPSSPVRCSLSSCPWAISSTGLWCRRGRVDWRRRGPGRLDPPGRRVDSVGGLRPSRSAAWPSGPWPTESC